MRWGYYAQRLLMVVTLLAAAALLPTGHGAGDRLRYREGDIARERVVAPYDFRVQKDEPVLRREQEEAGLAVPPVYVVDTRAQADVLNRWSAFQDHALALVSDVRVSPADRVARLKALGVPLDEGAADALAAPGRARKALGAMGAWLAELVQSGIVAEKKGGFILGYRNVTLREGETEALAPASRFLERKEALDRLAARARELFPNDPRGVQLVIGLAGPFVQSTVMYDRAETEWRRVQAQGAVPGVIGTVKKDELIVDANERVSREAVQKLRSLRNLELAKSNQSEFLYPPVARMLLMLLFIAAFATYLRMELIAVYRDNGMLAMFTLLTLAVLGSAVGLVTVAGFSEFTVPLALAPLVVASLLEKRPALVFTLVVAVLVTAVAELRAPFVPVAMMGGVTATYSVSRLRHRWHFVRAFFAIMLANLAAILAWDLAQTATTQVLLRDTMWGALNAFLSTMLAFMFLPLVESLFRLTSDITLLELSDLNRPLLRRMQLEAPGTYHHSMVVGSLAEAAAEAINANSLLARVAAYYHDIGKLAKPEYYAENEPAASRSRHEKLTPSMSALVVKSHITEGLELARKQRLPRAVLDAIPEHHGTMVMAFFYHKALETDPGARREDYSYPGPRPRSKETAILMLADGVEGASRALAEPTPSRIRGLVQRIIDERVRDGQLDDCGLTLQELARIRESFIPVLTAIFHVRVPYPDAPKKQNRADADLRRSGD
ncbi:MAG: HDIG domain-containing protein [Candidatus Eisenbacteria bacterium]|nr:HDIG domain-containing protein [Candidatus Eisenbacteria bacterium]